MLLFFGVRRCPLPLAGFRRALRSSRCKVSTGVFINLLYFGRPQGPPVQIIMCVFWWAKDVSPFNSWRVESQNRSALRACRERDRNGRPKVGSDPPTGGEGPIAVDSPTPRWPPHGGHLEGFPQKREDSKGHGAYIPMRSARNV
jgi:hypothetical protein